MKNIYINSRLHSLLIAYRRPPRVWLFSGGEPWLLLTPNRLERLANMLGLFDRRVDNLLDLVRRHEPEQEQFCRRLGVYETRYRPSSDNPPCPCPRCDNLHHPDFLDTDAACPSCRESEAEQSCSTEKPRLERAADSLARARLREVDPGSFEGDVLSPNFQYNRHRRLNRDWDRAANRILMGLTYRRVAREFDCAVGTLHKKVREHQNWGNN